jgi:hypothetical protein
MGVSTEQFIIETLLEQNNTSNNIILFTEN